LGQYLFALLFGSPSLWVLSRELAAGAVVGRDMERFRFSGEPDSSGGEEGSQEMMSLNFSQTFTLEAGNSTKSGQARTAERA
jgi:hypothetical protein